MKITEQESIKLSKYLIKGINDANKEKYHIVEINLNSTCVIGVRKKRRGEWVLYVKDGRKKDKKLNIPNLSQYPTLPDVYPIISEIINNSEIFKDKVLDLSRIPELPDVPEPKNETVQNSTPNSTVPVEKIEEPKENVSSMEEVSFVEEDLKEEPIKEHPLEEFVEESQNSLFEEKTTPVETPSVSEETIEVVNIKKEDSGFYEEIIEDMEKQEDEKMASNHDNQEQKNVDMKELKNFTIVPYGNLNIEENSYLYMLMKKHPERYINILKKMDDIIYRSSMEEAATRFITDLNDVLRLYNYDADKVAEELNIDKRDIAICICENKMMI